jgi:hypothetical protein
MNLQGALARFLKTGSIFYKKRADCFSQNQIVRDAWLRLAEDMDLQASSLKSLPPTFWKEIEKDQKDLMERVGSGFPIKGDSGPCNAVSLEESICRGLSLEEPVVLMIYAPLIRQLRTAWTNRALDFYVIVKSHVTGLMRLVQTYCGDPTLIQRATSLLGTFEKEAQEPEFVEIPRVVRKSESRKRRAAAHGPKGRAARNAPRKTRSRPLAHRARPVTKAAKPLVRKIRISSRRASR